MTAITAILHTRNDALRIARAVESLRPCDEVVVVDHGSSDATCQIAATFGARVVAAMDDSPESLWLGQAANDWILHIRPTEAVSEALEASLWEWKLTDTASPNSYWVTILEETFDGWISHPSEPRLVHREHSVGDGTTAIDGTTRHDLDGYLSRLRLP